MMTAYSAKLNRVLRVVGASVSYERETSPAKVIIGEATCS